MRQRVFTASAILLGACIGVVGAYGINQHYIAHIIPTRIDTPFFSSDGIPTTYVLTGTIVSVDNNHIVVMTPDPFTQKTRVLQFSIDEKTTIRRLTPTEIAHSYPSWKQESADLKGATTGEVVRIFMQPQPETLYATLLVFTSV